MDLFNNIQGATANIEATAMYVPEKQTKSSLTNWSTFLFEVKYIFIFL